MKPFEQEGFSIKIITDYISIWGWQLLAIIFLTSSIVISIFPTTITSIVFFITFFIVFVLCEYKSIIKKYELYKME